MSRKRGCRREYGRGREGLRVKKGGEREGGCEGGTERRSDVGTKRGKEVRRE